ncbi:MULTISPECIES: thiol reductant ABC exporter subunit CydD [unclassified Thioalkalivibrio]|uniref:thiol reductant ABC exporter subunit CydD n=1 Tax=unclassified Thioalkalivibrio TaxID=2621013 RepID=UPI00035C4D68|nr:MULTISPECIES: thiol reductant ABC exporter subunit CydD [unclassified Thioalkalivibrio]
MLSAASTLVATLATIALAGLVAWAVHGTLFAAAPPYLPGILLGGLALLGLRYAAQALRDLAGHRLAFAVKQQLRTDLLQQVRHAGPARLAGQTTAGAWAEQFQTRVDDLTGYYARYLPARQAVILTPLAILAAAFWLDWLAALLLLLAAPLIPAFMAIVGMGAEQIHRRQQEEANRLAGHFLDRIRSLDWLRRARAITATEIEVVERSHQQRRLTMRTLRVAFLSSAIMEFFSAVAIGMVAIYIGFALFGAIDYGPAGDITLFTGLFILLLAPEYFLPLRQFAQSYHDRAGALAAAESLAPALASPNGAEASAAVTEVTGGDETDPLLKLEDVMVHYPGQRTPVLQHLDLEIQAGAHLALTGPSGSGKSTLLAVCAGFLPPTEGRIQRHARARHFAWIDQDAHLFHGSLRENLQLARHAMIPDAEMATALEQAGLPLDAPELPDGLDTAIGEARHGLSGGQAQRVAVARALLSGHRLWLLDEPTSALDVKTEEALLDTLFRLADTRGLTLVIASHHAAIHRRCPQQLELAPVTPETPHA